jgi:predicted membrane channel-forming protein YqfA (hemolysin III family)
MLKEEFMKIDSSKKELRKFGITVGIALGIIAMALFRLHRGSFRYALIAGLVLLILGVAAPIVLRPIQRPWMAFSIVMGFVMTNLLTGLFFFLMVTPIGLIMRLAKKDILELRLDPNRESYWTRRDNADPDIASYEKQF